MGAIESRGFAERLRRHGYVQGAKTLFDAIEQHIPPEDHRLVAEWLMAVERWEKGSFADEQPPTAQLADVSRTSGA